MSTALCRATNLVYSLRCDKEYIDEFELEDIYDRVLHAVELIHELAKSKKIDISTVEEVYDFEIVRKD